jgi:hypothetical protein
MEQHLYVPAQAIEAIDGACILAVTSISRCGIGRTFATVDLDGLPYTVWVEMRHAEFVDAGEWTDAASLAEMADEITREREHDVWVKYGIY